jgi:hypothetical protein
MTGFDNEMNHQPTPHVAFWNMLQTIRQVTTWTLAPWQVGAVVLLWSRSELPQLPQMIVDEALDLVIRWLEILSRSSNDMSAFGCLTIVSHSGSLAHRYLTSFDHHVDCEEFADEAEAYRSHMGPN